MKIAEFREALSSLKQLAEQLQASKTSLSDLERLSTCLACFDDWSVSQLCSAIETLTDRRSVSNSKPLNENVVAKYSGELASTRGDRARLEEILSKMKADKQVRTGELDEIARRFVGGTSKYKSKADAYKEIRLTFEAQMAVSRRLDSASNIF